MTTPSPPAEGHATVAHGSALWLPPGSPPVTVGDYVIAGGLIYLGSDVPAAYAAMAEPSIIDPYAPVRRVRLDQETPDEDQRPSYAALTPGARAAYLEWLAAGRTGPTQAAHLWLFLYGLERRILVDLAGTLGSQQEYATIAAEVATLADRYSHADAFVTQAAEFTDLLDTLIGLNNPALRPPPIGPRTGDLPMRLRVGIGRYVARGLPLSPGWAYSWYAYSPHRVWGGEATRRPDEFRRAFAARYTEAYPSGGIRVAVPEETLILEYRPASPGFADRTVRIHTQLPDVRGVTAPLKELADLAILAEADLAGATRPTMPQAEQSNAVPVDAPPVAAAPTVGRPDISVEFTPVSGAVPPPDAGPSSFPAEQAAEPGPAGPYPGTPQTLGSDAAAASMGDNRGRPLPPPQAEPLGQPAFGQPGYGAPGHPDGPSFGPPAQPGHGYQAQAGHGYPTQPGAVLIPEYRSPVATAEPPQPHPTPMTTADTMFASEHTSPVATVAPPQTATVISPQTATATAPAAGSGTPFAGPAPVAEPTAAPERDRRATASTATAGGTPCDPVSSGDAARTEATSPGTGIPRAGSLGGYRAGPRIIPDTRPQVAAAEALLRLVTLAGIADEYVRAMRRHIVDALSLTVIERQTLDDRLSQFARHRPAPTVVRQRFLALPQEQQQQVTDLLIAAAGAHGALEPGQVAVLVAVFELLGQGAADLMRRIGDLEVAAVVGEAALDTTVLDDEVIRGALARAPSTAGLVDALVSPVPRYAPCT